ncbi:unnamed protein product [Lactuca saligna]|uniref:Uncharacterized protein n=1 Tax=Lactuca saligna TaxID=75948 RepID=A0AA36DWM5_LACSI|nr:unnamed protein product [Lactuca saligna]
MIDPVSEEENYQDGSLMITCLSSCNEVTELTITGEWSSPKIHGGMTFSSLSEHKKVEEAHMKAIQIDQKFLEAWVHLAQKEESGFVNPTLSTGIDLICEYMITSS